MKKGWANWFLTIFLCALLIPCCSLTAQTDLSEGWEVEATKRQPPDKVMAAIGVKRGMVIGEIGAGRGRYTVYLAREVGTEGKIFANDINKDALAYLDSRCKREGFNNIQIIIGKEEDPLFKPNSLDMAIMVWVYHMIEEPDNLLKNLIPALKPGAKLVILDPVDSEIDEEFNIDRSEPGVTIPTIKERIEKSARESGYELVEVKTFLEMDYIFILQPKDKGSVASDHK
ncbi:MAG: class I SAM-dependent methyltransferase [Bacteroidia bacterium]|nr:MAG: class I SAM-dependent methyltransferase [Bacteroidia bacterium]